MPRQHRTLLEIAKRRARVTVLHLQAKEPWEIAKIVGIQVATVYRDLEAMRAQWEAAAECDLDNAKQKELDRIDLLERSFWEAWQRSLADRETTLTEKITSAGSERLKASVRKSTRDGTASFLAGIQWCIARRCRLLGIDPPKTRLEGLVNDEPLTPQQQVEALDELLGSYVGTPSSGPPPEETPQH